MNHEIAYTRYTLSNRALLHQFLKLGKFVWRDFLHSMITTDYWYQYSVFLQVGYNQHKKSTYTFWYCGSTIWYFLNLVCVLLDMGGATGGCMSPHFWDQGVTGGYRGRSNENDLCFYSRQFLFSTVQQQVTYISAFCHKTERWNAHPTGALSKLESLWKNSLWYM